MKNNKINTVMEKINAISASQEKIFSILQDICYDFNINSFALAVFSGKQSLIDSFCLHSTYPKEWISHYQDKQYHLYDPVFGALKKAAAPFEWSTHSFKNLLPIQQLLMNEAYDFGIKSGETIPLIPHPTFHGFVTVINQPSLHPEALYILSLAANMSASKLIYIRNNQVIKLLTERETEILIQKSEGIAVKTISHNLGISQATITFHLKNIRKKLGAQSTEHALLKFATPKQLPNNIYQNPYQMHDDV